jgi:hypothetical protein
MFWFRDPEGNTLIGRRGSMTISVRGRTTMRRV